MNVKLKEFVRSFVHFTPQYHATRNSLEEQFSIDKLFRAVNQAIADVPYYRKHNYAELLSSDSDEFDISKLPLLSKDDVIGHEKDFVSDRFFKFLLRKEKTGGTTGRPMRLYYSPTLSIQRNAMPDILIERYAPAKSNIAILRGIRPEKNAICQHIGNNRLALSSYQISEDNISKYIDILRRENVAFMTAFPSSITSLAVHIKKRYGVCPDLPLNAIMTSSEIFDSQTKEFVMSVFPNIQIIDYYCMSEYVTAAYSFGLGYYEFNNNYGYVEFIDTGEMSPSGHRISRIVATSIMNETMPLIRYDTGDLVERDVDGNILSIIGRVNHSAVNRNNEVVPCIVIFSNRPISRVLQYQYYQDTPGHLIIKVLPNVDFTEEDRSLMLQNMKDCFADTMDCEVKLVDQIPRTRVGKISRMEQKLNLEAYRR